VRGSKTEYDKFKDADASYQDRESYKIVVEPMSSVYVHECPPESPAQGKIGTSWLTGGKRAIRCSNLDVGSAKSASHAGWRPVSNAKHEKFKDADCNHQHRESYGIVIEPMSRRYSHNRFLCRAATLASKLGTLMSSDCKAEDSTVFCLRFGNRLLKAGNRRLPKTTGRAGASIAICGQMVVS
jgi:hypothetical protein